MYGRFFLIGGLPRYNGGILKGLGNAAGRDHPWNRSWPQLLIHAHDRSMGRMVYLAIHEKHIHPGRLTWNLQIPHLERKMIFRTSIIVFHANLPGCKNQPSMWVNIPYHGSYGIQSNIQLSIVLLMVQKSGDHHMGCKKNL